ncbi:MAG: MFS transporter [Thermoleophilia bacterium]|nr:MFS transporter [Thermoleophilia bacterium]
MQTGIAASRALTVVVLAAVAVAFADSSIVVLALPDLYSELGTSIEGIAWVITSYNVAVAAVAFAALPLIRRLTPGVISRTGLAIFLGASIGCSLAGGLEALVLWRALQGIGGALLLVGTLPLLAGLCGEHRAGAIRWTTAGALGAALGPALGGLLTQLLDWRAIFVVQAPIAGAALLATLGGRARRPGPRELEPPPARPALAANAALGLVFGALVGALFLGVLLLVALWQLSPLGAAGVVTGIPAATLAVRPLAASLAPRIGVAGGALLLVLGLAALAFLPRTSILLAALALALCGAGLGLAVPTLSHAAVSVEHGLTRSGAWSIGARHLGLVAALVLVAPLLAFELERGAEHATLAGASAVLDSPVPLTKKVPLALDLRDAFEQAQQGELPDLGAAFDRRGAAEDERVAALRDELTQEIKEALTRSFRTAFALCAALAALALLPLRLVRRLEVW